MTGTFAAVYVALYVAHVVGDHWVQTDAQAAVKGAPGWRGRRACAAHVATYTATAALVVGAVAWRTGMHLSPVAVAVGLAVSAGSHYIADRRTPLVWLADRLGTGRFVRTAGGGISGAYLLDQSWHLGWLLVAALIVTA